jgi:hypothetical protein
VSLKYNLNGIIENDRKHHKEWPSVDKEENENSKWAKKQKFIINNHLVES